MCVYLDTCGLYRMWFISFIIATYKPLKPCIARNLSSI